MKTGMKKIMSVMLAASMIASVAMISGCGNKNEGKISVTIGDWPSDTDTNSKVYAEYKAKMEELYPDIEVVPDTATGNATSYVTRASSGQLPNMYVVSYTEVANAVKSGFCADITEYSKKYKYSQSLNPLVLDKVTVDNHVYGIPSTAYALGLACNRKLFEQAGLVNPDGSLQYPSTYEDVMETAVKIKEATGQAGISFPTMNNQGGWIFTCLAWSYGVKFMEQAEDGKWKATFDTDECVKALEYLKDLKWKHNVLPENAFVDISEERKLLASDQLAMYIVQPAERMLVKTYNMDKDDICFGRVPEGPAGRYTLMGGNVYMISPQSTPEQIDAVMKFLSVSGHSPEVTDQIRETSEKSMKHDFDENVPIMKEAAFPLWINEERRSMSEEIRNKYANVPDSNFADYSGFKDVIVHEEEPVCTQELYSILDSGIQEVLTNENADCKAIVKKMANDFQVNHLDKMN